jgi:hypothetical protein
MPRYCKLAATQLVWIALATYLKQRCSHNRRGAVDVSRHTLERFQFSVKISITKSFYRCWLRNCTTISNFDVQNFVFSGRSSSMNMQHYIPSSLSHSSMGRWVWLVGLGLWYWYCDIWYSSLESDYYYISYSLCHRLLESDLQERNAEKIWLGWSSDTWKRFTEFNWLKIVTCFLLSWSFSKLYRIEKLMNLFCVILQWRHVCLYGDFTPKFALPLLNKSVLSRREA